MKNCNMEKWNKEKWKHRKVQHDTNRGVRKITVHPSTDSYTLIHRCTQYIFLNNQTTGTAVSLKLWNIYVLKETYGISYYRWIDH